MGGRVAGRPYADTYVLPPAWEMAIMQWLAWLKIGGMSAQTMRLRRGHVRMMARRSATEHPRDLTLALIVDVCSAQAWSRDHRKGVRTSLVSFCDWAVSDGLVEENHAALLPMVSESKAAPRPVTDDVWRELLASTSGRELLMVRLAGEAGLRRAEVAACHRDDLFQSTEGYSLIVHGKGGKQRVVPIGDPLADAIRDHCPTGYLFPSIDQWGNLIAPHVSPHHVGKLISALLPPGYSMHKLRHRFATRAYRGSRNIRAVQMLLGHASVATTERYTACDSDEIRAAMMSAQS